MWLATANNADHRPALHVGETRWERLRDGVSCTWRSRENEALLWWHVPILLEVTAIFALAIFFGVRRGWNVLTLSFLLMSLGYQIMFTYAVIRGIRARGQPARLMVSERGGIRLWRRLNERPLVIPREIIVDVVVAGEATLLSRGWRLVVLTTPGHRTRRLFGTARRRSELIPTCEAIRQALGLK